MADTQYVPLGQGNAPAGWTLPTGLQINPKVCYASFDGTGAGAFVPCLRLVSDSGHVAAECVVGQTVAAGASADVTWFRGVSGSGGSGSGSGNAEWFIARRTTSQTMLASSQDTVIWSDLHSSDATLFSLATDNHPNDAVSVSRQGVLIMNSWISANALEADYVLGMLHNSDSGVSTNTYTPQNQWDTKGMPGSPNFFGPQLVSINVPDAVPYKVETFYRNFDTVNHTIANAQMWGLWWATGALSPF